MGKLYVCLKNKGYEDMLTINRGYMGYPSLFVKNWIHIIRCDDGQAGDFPPALFDLVEEYD